MDPNGSDAPVAFELLSTNPKQMFELQSDQESVAGLGGRSRVAGEHFTPCTLAGSLLEGMTEAAKCATDGDAVWLSPACSSSDQFRDDENCGEMISRVVKSTGGGALAGNPNINGRIATTCMAPANDNLDLFRVFLRENPGAKTNPTQSSTKGRN
jgi:hypothetical protein